MAQELYRNTVHHNIDFELGILFMLRWLKSMPNTFNHKFRLWDSWLRRMSLVSQFSSGEVFRDALKKHSIENGYEVIIPKNYSDWIHGMCKQQCGFRVAVVKLSNKNTFQIQSIIKEHRCARAYYNHNVNMQNVHRFGKRPN